MRELDVSLESLATILPPQEDDLPGIKVTERKVLLGAIEKILG